MRLRSGDGTPRTRTIVADFVYEIACSGDRAHEQAVQAWAERHAAPAWTALPGLTAVDLYQPVHGGTHDPFNDDGPGPLLMAMLQFPTREKLPAGLSDPRFGQSLTGMPVAATGTGFERRFFPVAGAPNPGPLRAPFSYVVRSIIRRRTWRSSCPIMSPTIRRSSASCRRSDRCCAICRSAPAHRTCWRRPTT